MPENYKPAESYLQKVPFGLHLTEELVLSHITLPEKTKLFIYMFVSCSTNKIEMLYSSNRTK